MIHPATVFLLITQIELSPCQSPHRIIIRLLNTSYKNSFKFTKRDHQKIRKKREQRRCIRWFRERHMKVTEHFSKISSKNKKCIARCIRWFSSLALVKVNPLLSDDTSIRNGCPIFHVLQKQRNRLPVDANISRAERRRRNNANEGSCSLMRCQIGRECFLMIRKTPFTAKKFNVIT